MYYEKSKSEKKLENNYVVFKLMYNVKLQYFPIKCDGV